MGWAEKKIAKIAKNGNRPELKNVMIKERYSPEHRETTPRTPEARYAYYRRCQVFRKGGAQCKAPAEKGSHICHAHAGQLATAVRRERELGAVLAEAVGQMRRRGKPECEMADLFMDFNGIQTLLAVMAQAVIDGRIECKTSGRLLVQLQAASKLLWMLHRKGRKENGILPQICADDSTLSKEKASTTKNTKEHEGRKTLPLMNADNTDLKESGREQHLTIESRGCGEQQKPLPQINAANTDLGKAEEAQHLTREARRRAEQQTTLPLMNADNTDLKETGREQHLTIEPPRHGERPRAERNWTANQREETRIALVGKVRALAERCGWAHAPPELLRAA